MGKPIRILVVDDELPVCQSVSSALAIEDYTVEMALSGEEALEKQARSPYDVVITDLMMPGLSGMDLLRTVTRDRPETKVIMITGYPSIKSAVEATKLGAFDYIPKPFTPDELRSLVSRAIKSKRYHETQKITPPPGIYCMPENSWAAVEENHRVRIGVHHLFLRTIDRVISIELPEVGATRYQGEVCARLHDSRGHVHKLWAPVCGVVTAINDQSGADYSSLIKDPYAEGWLFVVAPTDLETDLKNLVKVTP
ncbi:MAG: response regulator [Candidatus Eisenbacteria bacterium]